MATATVNITVRTRGLWKVVLLGWAIPLFGLRQQHVDIEMRTV